MVIQVENFSNFFEFSTVFINSGTEDLELLPLLSPSSTPGGDEDTRLVSFCRKLNFIQFLFEAFFIIIGTFGSVQLQSKHTLAFQYIIITSTLSILHDPIFDQFLLSFQRSSHAAHPLPLYAKGIASNSA